MARAGPTTIGRYRLNRRVGAGGMGVVYDATDTRRNERVALKVLLPHAAEEAEGLLRFKREFRALARLRHPNIVRVLDAGIEDDVPFIAMEFLDGRDARRHLKSIPIGPVRDRELRRCLRQIFGALSHIHARRIVHRDLKPENIIVCEDGRVKVMDFGVARVLKSPTSGGESGLLGTFAYMSPEQVTGGEIDGRADLYALGVLMYELLTGDYPFPVEPPAAALHHHVNTVPESVLKRAPEADPQLAELTHALLEKDPLDRLQTAEEAFRFLTDETQGSSPAIENTPQQPGQLFAPRFVGGDEEMTALLELIRDAEAGYGRLVLLEGPSGIGKSRLVQELKSRVKKQVSVLAGPCAPERTQQAYAPIQTVLDEIESIASRSNADVVRKIVGRDASLVRSISPRLARLGGPARTEHLDPNERKVRLHKAVVGVVGRLSLTRPVVLVIEDLHWADSTTLELLWDASRTLLAPRPGKEGKETVCPVAILLTRRSLAEGPDASEGLLRRLEERKMVTRVAVKPQSEAGVENMLRTMTGTHNPIPEAVAALVSAAHGRPRLVGEILESWVQEGTLVREQGNWLYQGEPLEVNKADESSRGESVAKQVVPKEPDEVARLRLDQLEPPARTLIERLALLGRLLPADLVATLWDGEEEVFLDAIDELVRARLLAEDVAHDRVRYRFEHEGFREAVIRSLPPERKASLHAFIAQRLESRFIRRRSELAHVLARHHKAGGQLARAVRYLEQLGRQAATRGDVDGALRRLEDARNALNDRPQNRATATRRLRLLLMEIDMLLDFGRAREALDRADPQAALPTRNPELMKAELTLRRATALFALSRLEDTLDTLAEMPGRAPTRSLAARFLELEGRTRVALGEYVIARAVLEEALTLAGESNHLGLARSLDARIGVVMTHQGEHEAAEARLLRGLDHARAAGDQRQVTHLLGHLGLVRVARGDSADAQAAFREAIELAEARAFSSDLGRWTGELGRLLAESKDEGAVAQLERAATLAAEAGHRPEETRWRRELGAHHLKLGELGKARSELDRALRLAEENELVRAEAYVRFELAALALEANYDRVEDALEEVKRGLEIAEERGDRSIESVGLLHLARVCRAQGNLTRARELLQRAAELVSRTPDRRLAAKIARAREDLEA